MRMCKKNGKKDSSSSLPFFFLFGATRDRIGPRVVWPVMFNTMPRRAYAGTSRMTGTSRSP